MATLQYAHSASVSHPSRTRGLLIETMQLVEPRKHPPVPNHLLESKIYSKVALNSVVQARPAVIHFGGFSLGQVHRQILQIANISTEVQRMHIIPPQTEYFSIQYTKGDRLVPGLMLDCVIEFYPDEWRYYYDCIRIHTPGGENLLIPIHAYPVMSTEDWPQQITFQPIPVGHSSSRVIPLRCNAPIDFEYGLTILQHHPAFVIEPMSGVVPANGEVDIQVTFTPSEFSTAQMSVQLKVSQFNAKPLVCNIMGSSVPGLAKCMAGSALTDSHPESLEFESRVMSPLDRVRSNKKTGKKRVQSKTSVQASLTSNEVEFGGIKFPSNLDTPYAVTQVLVQEPGKLRIKDLREAIDMKKGKSVAQTRQMKEAVFEMAVRQDVYEERQNQLRWQVKLGDDQIKSEARQEITENREAAWREYKLKRGDPVVEKECLRNCTKCSFRRSRRDCENVAPDSAQFDTYTNDMWAVRHSAISKLRQAAWKILIRNRAEKKLAGLRDMVLNWGKQGFAFTGNAELTEKDKADDDELETLDKFVLEAPKVTSVTFPTYAPPNVKDDMAVDALGPVPYQPTEVAVKKKVAYHDLKVPQQYRLMRYRRHNVHEASLNYVPATLMRELRTGALDELINLPGATDEHKQEASSAQEEKGQSEVVTSVVAPLSKTAAAGGEVTLQSDREVTLQPLRPPQALFRPIDYPPLHIFNAAPGLQVFQPPMAYAETDPDFHLCPLPRYTQTNPANPHMATQRAYLDREDVVRGVMGWKRFPSQGLTSLSNTPTLTNVWVPRWNDTFEGDLLPLETPPLQHTLADSDLENVDEEEEKADEVLTPDMVNAQFSFIDTKASTPDADKHRKDQDLFPHGNRMPPTNIPVSACGFVAREKREEELEYFMKKKYNRLGTKFGTKIDHMNTLKTSHDLVLK